LTDTLDHIFKVIQNYGFIRIIPAVNIDALIASSILAKNLVEHNIHVALNIDPKIIVDNRDEPTLLIDLQQVSGSREQFVLKYDGNTSISSKITMYLDNVFGVSKWDKTLTLVASIYRRLDYGKDGFTGIEREILDELVRDKKLTMDLGLKLWGWRRYGLPKCLYRTLIPFIPGYTGEYDRLIDVLKNVLEVSEPEKIMGYQVIIFTDDKIDKTRDYLERLSMNMKYVSTDLKTSILLNLIGYVYYSLIDSYEFELHELMGAIDLFLSRDENIPYTTLLSMDDTIVYQVMAYYELNIDETVENTARNIIEYLVKNKHILDACDKVHRPELYRDILDSIGKLPVNKPVSILLNGRIYTSVQELLRLKYNPDKLYGYCLDNQLCMVDENGNLVKT